MISFTISDMSLRAMLSERVSYFETTIWVYSSAVIR